MSNSFLSSTLKIIFVFSPINAVTNFHKNGEKYLKMTGGKQANRNLRSFVLIQKKPCLRSQLSTLRGTAKSVSKFCPCQENGLNVPTMPLNNLICEFKVWSFLLGRPTWNPQIGCGVSLVLTTDTPVLMAVPKPLLTEFGIIVNWRVRGHYLNYRRVMSLETKV